MLGSWLKIGNLLFDVRIKVGFRNSTYVIEKWQIYFFALIFMMFWNYPFGPF